MTKRKVFSAQEQRLVVLSDKFLSRLYLESVESVEHLWKAHTNRIDAPTKVLEIGAAGGITKNIRPEWLTIDVREADGVDFILKEKESWPVADHSIEVVFMQDVIHHITDISWLVDEIDRVLIDGGLVVCREPYWSLPAQIVWRFFHAEDFNVKRVPEFFSKGQSGEPMEGNQAIAWLLCADYLKAKRERETLKVLTDRFEITRQHATNCIAFLLSGGATYTTKVNREFLLKLHELEKQSRIWNQLMGFGVFMTMSRLKTVND